MPCWPTPERARWPTRTRGSRTRSRRCAARSSASGSARRDISCRAGWGRAASPCTPIAAATTTSSCPYRASTWCTSSCGCWTSARARATRAPPRRRSTPRSSTGRSHCGSAGGRRRGVSPGPPPPRAPAGFRSRGRAPPACPPRPRPPAPAETTVDAEVLNRAVALRLGGRPSAGLLPEPLDSAIAGGFRDWWLATARWPAAPGKPGSIALEAIDTDAGLWSVQQLEDGSAIVRPVTPLSTMLALGDLVPDGDLVDPGAPRLPLEETPVLGGPVQWVADVLR